MKKFVAIAVALSLVSCIGGTEPPAAPLELAKTPAGVAIGTPSTTAIGVTGGRLDVSSVGAKVIVPAGAMPDGSSLTAQAISNTLDGSNPGIRLSGSDWTQPITIQFAYPSGITDPENYMIAVQNPNGSWVSSNVVKVDSANRTIAIRLAPDPSSLFPTGGLRAIATTSSRDLLWTKKFEIQPNTATIKCGESILFTAYGRLARSKYETKISAEELDVIDRATAELDAADLKSVEAGEEPLGRLLGAVGPAKLVPFTNTKAGYVRKWEVAGPGTIGPSGPINGKYTAPKNANGKTAYITFFSYLATNAGRIAVAHATVNISCDPYARNGGY